MILYASGIGALMGQAIFAEHGSKSRKLILSVNFVS